MAMNAEYINPFYMASTSVLGMFGLELKQEKPYVKKTSEFEPDQIVICLGIVGQVTGQVLLVLTQKVALDLASKMCMMPITELDDISRSAISELGNMVMGNAATLLSTKGIIIDITPPTLIQGNFKMDAIYAENICIPMNYGEGMRIELDVSLKEAQ